MESFQHKSKVRYPSIRIGIFASSHCVYDHAIVAHRKQLGSNMPQNCDKGTNEWWAVLNEGGGVTAYKNIVKIGVLYHCYCSTPIVLVDKNQSIARKVIGKLPICYNKFEVETRLDGALFWIVSGDEYNLQMYHESYNSISFMLFL